MKPHAFSTATFFLIIVFSIALMSCSEPEPIKPIPPVDPPNVDKLVFSPHEIPLGKTYSQWIREWLEHFPASKCGEPGTYPGDSYTTMDQSQRVYFLPGSSGKQGATSIAIAPGKALLFPLLNIVETYPCISHDGFTPDEGQSVEEFLKRKTARTMGIKANITMTLDNFPYSFPQEHRFVTGSFPVLNNYTLGNCFNACIATNVVQEAVSDGYWIMIRNLEEGEHILAFRAEIPEYGLVSDVSYHIIAR